MRGRERKNKIERREECEGEKGRIRGGTGKN